MAKLSEDFRSYLRFFAFYVGNGSLCDEVFGDFDYRARLLEDGNALEQLFAIYTNVLELDDRGKVLNNEIATKRVAQWLRSWLDNAYSLHPPFEPWELELHGP